MLKIRQIWIISSVYGCFLFFSLNILADDISDFQIEGISIGNSALDFFTEEEIKKNSFNYYKDKTYTPVQNDGPLFFKTYDAVDFAYKNNDKQYKIVRLSGILFYDDNIKDCYPKMEEINKELKILFNNVQFTDLKTFDHPDDPETNPNKKSKVTDVYGSLEGGVIHVACYDYSEKDGSQDHLSVTIKTTEFDNFLFTAYD